MQRNKPFLTGMILLVMIAMLSACSGKSNNANGAASSPEASTTQPSPSASASPAASEDQEATREFTDDIGRKVTLPTHPKRIVVDQFMGHLLALGVKPVGAATYQFDAAFLKPLTDGIEDIGSPISLEKVLALQPDLILLQDGGNTVESYDAYSKIAPTIVLSYGSDDSKNVLEQLRQIGDIVGKQDEAAAWIAKYQIKADDYNKQIQAAIGPDKTFSIVEQWAKQTVIYGKNFGRGGFNLYDSLHLSPPKKVQEEMFDKNESWKEVSMETLSDYVGDYIFLTINAGEQSAAREQDLKSSKLWQNLPAVKNGRVFQVKTDEFYPGDPISVDKQLDIQAKLLLSLVK